MSPGQAKNTAGTAVLLDIAYGAVLAMTNQNFDQCPGTAGFCEGSERISEPWGWVSDVEQGDQQVSQVQPLNHDHRDGCSGLG